MMQNTLLLDALARRTTPRRPIWFMRQAGRYLPEYQVTRKKAGGFMALCKNPELACEVSLQPIERYGLDAAILFSDILTIPDAMGLELTVTQNHGPQFKYATQTEKRIKALPDRGVNTELSYVFDAVQKIKSSLKKTIPLLGFSGSPWTLATYMVEGGTSQKFSVIKKMLYEAPALLHLLLEKLSNAVTDYLNQQILSGVDAIQIFDTWAGILTEQSYQTFSLSYLQRIVGQLKTMHPNIPIILFSKQTGQWLPLLKTLPVDCLSVDWTLPLSKVRTLIGSKFSLQGNLDPQVLLSSPEKIRTEAIALLDDYGTHSGHIFNLGHGLTPDLDPAHVGVLVDTVKAYAIDDK